ncbi:MAG TPA: hypothetical protein VFS63_13980 [Pseudolabrys sp.]|nr:hypothetical protein [Pseudolabrys sp.]
MTFPDDPNLNRTSKRTTGGTPYTGWIVGLLILIAVIVIFAWANTGRNAGTASNNNNPPATASQPATPPATTGSGTTSPAPSGTSR